MSDHRKKAVIYRMVMDDHVCPFGLKSKDLLEQKGFDIEDHHLTTRQQTDAFQKQHDVDTTPQIWVNGSLVGGYDELCDYFGIE